VNELKTGLFPLFSGGSFDNDASSAVDPEADIPTSFARRYKLSSEGTHKTVGSLEGQQFYHCCVSRA
jgi:hypothetical protein